MIVDVDSHWELGQMASGEHPLGPWLDRLPTGIDLLAFAVAGDLLASLPPERRPAPAELLPGLVRAAEARGGPVMLHPKHHSGADERIEWMDRVGIDHCLVNPGGYWQMLPFVPAGERPAAVQRCNDFLAEQLAPGAGRLHSVAVLDWSSPEAAVAELERCRGLGARAFFLATDQGQPAGGIAPGHPVWDGLWAAAVRNGMVAVIHVGNTSAGFGAWGDVGWDQPGGSPAGVLGRLANTQRAMGAQNLIASMLYGGVFAKFPELTVLLEEMRVNWLPPFVETLTRQAADSPIMGDWPWPVSGGEMLRRNLRTTPLPGFGDTDALDVLRALPEMVVFSSDYPHLEGNAEPIDLYRPELDDLDEELRAAFMGGTMAECYVRTGDPLPAAC